MGVIAAAALWTWNEISLGLVDIQQGVKELGRGKNVKMSKKYSLCIPGAAATCPSEVLKGGSAFLERCWALPGSALGALGQVLGWVSSLLSWVLSLCPVLGWVLSPLGWVLSLPHFIPVLTHPLRTQGHSSVKLHS